MSDLSEVSGNDSGTAPAAEAEAPPQSYGARLAWERGRAGLTVNDIAARLRLHPNQVLAIEHEDLAKLPAMAYVRGFIRSYARIVNTDAAPLLTDLATRTGPAATEGSARREDAAVSSTADSHLWRHVVLAGALLLLSGLAVVGWVTGLPASAPEAPRAVTPTAPVVTSEPAAAITVAPPAVTAAVVEPAPVASDAAPPTPDGSLPVAPAPVPLLSLEFSGPCWVEVTAADGRVLLSERADAGVVRRLNQAPPLTVVLGDANQARVLVRGEAFDLAAFTRQNVARFSVN